MSDVYVALLRDVFFVGSTFFEYHYLDDNKLIRWNCTRFFFFLEIGRINENKL